MSDPNQPEPRIIVIFRNDDPSALSDLDHERRIFALFEEYGVPQTIAVIPNISTTMLDETKCGGTRSLLENPPMVEFLREHVSRCGSEVALHGYSHRTNRYSNPTRRDYFEFQQLPYEEQLQMIRQGTAILEQAFGERPVTFVPPWNRLDRSTLKACHQTGYRFISANAHTLALDGMGCSGTNCTPAEFAALWEDGKRSQHKILISILFHSNTTQSPEAISQLEKILATVAADPECQCMTIKEVGRLWPERIRWCNEAGRNEVSLHEVQDSPRAKVWFYLQLAPMLRRVSGLEKLQNLARRQYREGAYEVCVNAGKQIDNRCTRLLWAARTVSLTAGFTIGMLMIGASILAGVVLPGIIVWALPLLIGISGFIAARLASAVTTRRETVVAACLCGGGLYAALLSANLLFAR
jgi:peptidoglycan/xylan/chitin deacetylase (PgdA/CDA1 family)